MADLFDNRWWSVFANPRRGKNGRPGPPVHDDLVQRNFRADNPNCLWLSDITEHRTGEGKLYMCAVKDVFPTGSSATRLIHG
ncbi:transposase InsO family protein [Nocardia kruczakiae]|uniref:Transposase InsO family protein n=1 Tax=Nocardia kruczakiae TaxID=261477 RepID=A0ABU1XT74_9NOCA|nr:transposase InsO family protein [Nocardia kruczakiae]